MMMKRLPITLACMLALALLAGCANVQPAAELTDPVSVYIGDYGIHSSLFLPTQDGRFVEYAFGDWGYAVENRNMPQDAIGALTMSWGAGFGRMYHPAAPQSGIPSPVRKPMVLHAVTCDRSDVYLLIDRLDVRFEQLRDRYGQVVINEQTGMSWVREDPDKRYSIANNCNHLTARTLRELGCRVSGVVVWSKFNVADAPAQTGLTPSTSNKPAANAVGWASVE